MGDERMSQPITRGELHDALESWAVALLARLDERFAKIDERFATIEQELATKPSHEDLARHARTIMEANAAHIAILDEKYADLPGRMDRVERAVYKRTKRAPGRSPARRRR